MTATSEPTVAPPSAPPQLYDTTLRDGTQQEGISLTVDDKLRIARILDTLGVAFIEGGWPGANPKDTEFFKRAASGELALSRAVLTAFGMTRRPGAQAAGDPTLEALLGADTEVVCLVGKSDRLHVSSALRTTREENLAMVASSVELLRVEGRRVLFDAEHFFDGYRRDAAYALEVLDAAADAGVECVVLCDTNGGALPAQVGDVVGRVVARVGGRVDVGVHVHNDADCAVANSLVGLQAGARHVQGTVNGIGERCGNANLMSLIPNLKLKLGMDVVSDHDLSRLTHVAHEVAEIMNLTPDPHAPYVGHAAFAHKAGLHVSALARRTDLYQHVEPELVGNTLRLLVSELAGRSTIVLKGRELGLDLESDRTVADRILSRVKALEHVGYSFEAADASFELLVRAETGLLREHFRLESYRTIVERRDDGSVVAEATVKVWVGGERLIGTGEGNGPVDALDRAFRAALDGHLPAIAGMHLRDYKVRILDQNAGTGATTRVLIRSTDGEQEWDTVGVSSNVIEASWMAMEDAYATAFRMAAERGVASP
ncbi:MAG: citramalate synthase [Actinobacteria bacterium]|nr:citramalate synthase [Actinomycetota bacterium]